MQKVTATNGPSCSTESDTDIANQDAITEPIAIRVDPATRIKDYTTVAQCDAAIRELTIAAAMGNDDVRDTYHEVVRRREYLISKQSNRSAVLRDLRPDPFMN